jgi:reverse gyrase
MITITATFEIDESHHYFDGKKVKDWFAYKIVSGELTASIHLTDVHIVDVITTREYNGVTTSAKKTIPQYKMLANTIQLKLQ